MLDNSFQVYLTAVRRLLTTSGVDVLSLEGHAENSLGIQAISIGFPGEIMLPAHIKISDRSGEQTIIFSAALPLPPENIPATVIIRGEPEAGPAYSTILAYQPQTSPEITLKVEADQAPVMDQQYLAGRSLASLLAGPNDSPILATEKARRYLAERRRLTRHSLTAGASRDTNPDCAASWEMYICQHPELNGGDGKQRICLVTQDLMGLVRCGGIGTFYASLAELLVQAGHEVVVLYIDNLCEAGSPALWQHHYQSHRITLEYLPPYPYPAWTDPHLLRSQRIYEWLKARSFDWIHFHEMWGSGYCSVLAKRQGIAFQNSTLCVGLHSPSCWHLVHNRELSPHYAQLLWDHLEKVSVAEADVVFCPSQFLMRWVLDQGWKLPQRAYVIPSPPPLLSGAKPARSAEKPLLEVVFFGRLETQKGLELFCDALDLLQSLQTPTFLITFLGKPGGVNSELGDQYVRMRSAAWRQPVQLITSFGQAQALEYLTAGGRLAVLPSIADNSPYALFECLDLQIPFLAANSSGIPEHIHPDDRERVLCETTPEAWAQKILTQIS